MICKIQFFALRGDTNVMCTSLYTRHGTVTRLFSLQLKLNCCSVVFNLFD